MEPDFITLFIWNKLIVESQYNVSETDIKIIQLVFQ